MSREVVVSTIPVREPVVRPDDRITKVWERYFYDLWRRTGGPRDNVNGPYNLVDPDGLYMFVTRVSGLVSNITFWVDNSMTQKVTEEIYTRTGGLITSYQILYYDQNGSLFATENHTVTRSSGLVQTDEVNVT